SQEPGGTIGSSFTYDDLLEASNWTGSHDVETYDTPVEITTLASIEGGATVKVGTAPISGAGSASLLVEATDNSTLASNITTDTPSYLDHEFVEGKIGVHRDTQAYIGDAITRTTVSNTGGAATGLVKVAAENLGSVSGDVFSDFLEFKSSIFSRENALAYVENTDLIAKGLIVSADSSSAYATRAEDNSITFRGSVDAHIKDSVVTAGTDGVTVEALDDSSFSGTSYGQGSRSSSNDLRNDVTAYAVDST
ncbi:MAG: hypothetical protein GY722_16285, partial [bacterium]|nr:hypothetical protein [bacterium]